VLYDALCDAMPSILDTEDGLRATRAAWLDVLDAMVTAAALSHAHSPEPVT
jgi:hypothetical protein